MPITSGTPMLVPIVGQIGWTEDKYEAKSTLQMFSKKAFAPQASAQGVIANSIEQEGSTDNDLTL